MWLFHFKSLKLNKAHLFLTGFVFLALTFGIAYKYADTLLLVRVGRNFLAYIIAKCES